MAEHQRDEAFNEYNHKLPNTFFANLSSVESVKFGFLRLGPLCNASESNAFTLARCHHRDIKNRQGQNYVIDLKKIFTLAMDLLEKLKNNETPRFSEREIAAIKKLETFIKQKDKHETSMRKILLEHINTRRKRRKRSRKKYIEREMAATLAEHLFKLLAPGGLYLIDGNIREKDRCQCVCGSTICEKPNFGSTNVGHGKVWHGSLDIVFYPDPGAGHQRNNDAAFSPKGRNIIEVKRNSLSGSRVCNQAIAETIVFSFYQKKQYPHISISPNILISPKELRVIMYDAANDILICSQPLNLFTTKSKRKNLDVSSIIILWMVLHYEMFLKQENSPFTNPDFNKENYQANFENGAGETIDLYRSELEFGVNNFRSEIVRETFPDFDSLSSGVNVLNIEE